MTRATRDVAAGGDVAARRESWQSAARIVPVPAQNRARARPESWQSATGIVAEHGLNRGEARPESWPYSPQHTTALTPTHDSIPSDAQPHSLHRPRVSENSVGGSGSGIARAIGPERGSAPLDLRPGGLRSAPAPSRAAARNPLVTDGASRVAGPCVRSPVAAGHRRRTGARPPGPSGMMSIAIGHRHAPAKVRRVYPSHASPERIR